MADSLRRERGGVAANIAYTMKLLGADPIVFATVGQDFGDYRRWMEEHGLRTDHIVEVEGEYTASFFVGSDLEENQIAIFYTGAMAQARNYSLEDQGLADSQIVLISPNDPLAMLKYAQECRELGIAYAYDPSQQIARLSGEDLAASIPGAAYLLCNEYELGMVQKKTGWSLDDIRGEVGVLVNTLGKDGIADLYRRTESTRYRRCAWCVRWIRRVPAMPIEAACLQPCLPGCLGRFVAASVLCAAPMPLSMRAQRRTRLRCRNWLSATPKILALNRGCCALGRRHRGQRG